MTRQNIPCLTIDSNTQKQPFSTLLFVSSRKMNKIDKPLFTLAKKKDRRQKLPMMNETRGINTDLMDIKRVIREY